MGGRASAILYLPLSQDGWRDAVRSFVGAEKRNIFTVEVSVAKPDGRVIAFDSWASGARTVTDLAEGITEWIELRCESGSTEDLEATVSVCDGQAR
jgi:hypothetical protein